MIGEDEHVYWEDENPNDPDLGRSTDEDEQRRQSLVNGDEEGEEDEDAARADAARLLWELENIDLLLDEGRNSDAHSDVRKALSSTADSAKWLAGIRNGVRHSILEQLGIQRTDAPAVELIKKWAQDKLESLEVHDGE